MLQDLEETHHSQLVVAVNQLYALLGEPRPTNGDQLELGAHASQSASDTRCVKIPRRFARDEENFTHCCARARPAKEESARSPSLFGARHPTPIFPLRR